jgi:8-oxo-dGTP pyrophosphatase MutT (NUDIX family)
MLLSCGVLLLNEHDELFVAHATGSSYWDLPKGLADPGEAPRAAAIREAREETGVRLEEQLLLDLGEFDYLPHKRLHLFAAKTLKARLDPGSCVCTSLFWDRRTQRRLPEADAFAWIPFAQIPQHCAKSMTALLSTKLDLVDLARRLPLAACLL